MPDKQVDTAIKVVLGPCIDDTDFKMREEALTYDQAGMEIDAILEKHDGTVTVTAITPTTSGVHDWAHKDQGNYELEIPASGGDFNNDTEGTLTVVGFCTGVLPFRSIAYNIVNNKHVHHVSKSGNDSNHGHSKSGAVLTVGQAITNAASGDTIIIHPGTYADETLAVSSKVLLIKGTNRNSCKIVDSANDGLETDSAIILEDLWIESNAAASWGLYVTAAVDHVIARNCTIIGTKSSIEVTGANNNVVFEDCYLEGDWYGIDVSGDVASLIRNCHIRSTGTYTNEKAMGVNAGLRTILEGCTVYAYLNQADTDECTGVNLTQVGILSMSNCVVCVKQDNVGSTGATFGIDVASGLGAIHNCSFSATNDGSGTCYDVEASSKGMAVVSCCNYATSHNIYDVSPDFATNLLVPLTTYHLDHLIQTSAIVYASGGDVEATSSVFDTYLTEDTDDHYKGMVILFTSGALAGQGSHISAYDGTTKVITVDPPFTEAPSYDTFVITGQFHADKTGYKLASDGLDSVSVTEPAGVASNFREMLVQTWRRWFIKTELDEEAGTLKTYKDNDTVCTTQTVEETGGVQTVEDAS